MCILRLLFLYGHACHYLCIILLLFFRPSYLCVSGESVEKCAMMHELGKRMENNRYRINNNAKDCEKNKMVCAINIHFAQFL